MSWFNIPAFGVPTCAIPLKTLEYIADPRHTFTEKNSAATRLLLDHDMGALVSLWMMQGWQNPKDTSGVSSATRWWLHEDNPYRRSIAQQLTLIPDELLAQHCLEMASLEVATDAMSVVLDDPMVEPYACNSYSRLSAGELRELATIFLPNHPQLAEATCPLYVQTMRRAGDHDNRWIFRYREPMEAFADNVHAQRYLACAAFNNVADLLPLEWQLFRRDKNEAWRMYEQMGLTLREGYQLAMQPTAQPSLELPNGTMEL